MNVLVVGGAGYIGGALTEEEPALRASCHPKRLSSSSTILSKMHSICV